MIDIENMKYIVEQEIKKRHFESLQYVLFDETKSLPWAFHLFYKDKKFMINGRDDRSYIMGNTIKFDNFEEAKTAFISKLENFVESTRKGLKVGFSPYYPLPLWDKIEADIENMKCIVEQEIKKRHFESLQYVLFDENKNFPWAFHLFYRDGKFMINGRDDRSYVMGNTIEFTRFEDAKIAFLERLEHFVKTNQLKVKIGKKPYYSSPLWDNEKAD